MTAQIDLLRILMMTEKCCRFMFTSESRQKLHRCDHTFQELFSPFIAYILLDHQQLGMYSVSCACNLLMYQPIRFDKTTTNI